jgi:hypothetical protein
VEFHDRLVLRSCGAVARAGAPGDGNEPYRAICSRRNCSDCEGRTTRYMRSGDMSLDTNPWRITMARSNWERRMRLTPLATSTRKDARADRVQCEFKDTLAHSHECNILHIIELSSRICFAYLQIAQQLAAQLRSRDGGGMSARTENMRFIHQVPLVAALQSPFEVLSRPPEGSSTLDNSLRITVCSSCVIRYIETPIGCAMFQSVLHDRSIASFAKEKTYSRLIRSSSEHPIDGRKLEA